MPQTMEAVFVAGEDQRRIDYTPGSDVACGTIVDLGAIIGVVTSPEGLTANRLGSLATAGSFRIKKAAGGNAITQGAFSYFNTSTRLGVNAAGTNIIKVGVASRASVAGDDGTVTEINLDFAQ
jgi:predicted RecA/RadA family phage recombinase